MSASKSQLFGKEEIAMNALYQAVEDCGGYYFLETTPRTTLTVVLVEKLRENGFDITKLDDPKTDRALHLAKEADKRARRSK